MKILIINCFLHEKNKQGLIAFLGYLQENIEYKFGSVADISTADIIYSPSQPLNSLHYPNKQFIFGPHFSVFPDDKLQFLNAKNSIYIQPSEWVVQLWENKGATIPIKCFPFPVNTDKFQPISPPEKRTNIFIYYKRRNPQELNQLKVFLQMQHITNYRVFDYTQHYNENDYLHYLQTCQYGIILDAHESQGFAIEEAMACDVPLLVWNAQTMNQEHGSHYESIPCTSIPYWAPTCGEVFHNLAELPLTFQTFQAKLQEKQYKPRDYILATLSTEKCAERFMEIIIK